MDSVLRVGGTLEQNANIGQFRNYVEEYNY